MTPATSIDSVAPPCMDTAAPAEPPWPPELPDPLLPLFPVDEPPTMEACVYPASSMDMTLNTELYSSRSLVSVRSSTQPAQHHPAGPASSRSEFNRFRVVLSACRFKSGYLSQIFRFSPCLDFRFTFKVHAGLVERPGREPFPSDPRNPHYVCFA